jgi:hypothetical protein
MHFLTSITHKNIFGTRFIEFGCYELETDRPLWHCRPRPSFEAAWLQVRIPLTLWMFVSCVCCVGSGFCDELITHSEESHRLCVSVSDIETSTIRWRRPEMGCGATDKKSYWEHCCLGIVLFRDIPVSFLSLAIWHFCVTLQRRRFNILWSCFIE